MSFLLNSSSHCHISSVFLVMKFRRLEDYSAFVLDSRHLYHLDLRVVYADRYIALYSVYVLMYLMYLCKMPKLDD